MTIFCYKKVKMLILLLAIFGSAKAEGIIPSMIRMLNSYQKKKIETLKKIDIMPVNNVLFSPYHCDNKKP